MAKRSPLYAGDPALVSLGMAVRAARMEMGLSQEALADAAEVDRSYMGGVERGEHNLSVMRLLKVCAALRLSPSALLKRAGYGLAISDAFTAFCVPTKHQRRSLKSNISMTAL